MVLRHGLIALILLSVLHGVAGTQNNPKETRFIPQTFFVGDPVIMILKYDIESSLQVETPNVFPESDWIEIQDISIERDGNSVEVRISFVSFAAGSRVFPSINLGDLKIWNIRIPTRSILSNDYQGARRIRGQLLLPRTKVVLVLVLVLLASSLFVVYALVRLLWALSKFVLKTIRAGRPSRNFKRLLKGLRAGVGTDSSVVWFSELTDGLRIYLSEKTSRDYRSATTAEISLMPGFETIDSASAKLLEILREGDLVKFAGQFADDRRMENTLNTVQKAVQDWEKINDSF